MRARGRRATTSVVEPTRGGQSDVRRAQSRASRDEELAEPGLLPGRADVLTIPDVAVQATLVVEATVLRPQHSRGADRDRPRP